MCIELLILGILSTLLSCQRTFLILTFFKIILKLTPGKYYLHRVTLMAARRGAARGADVGPGLPRHIHWRRSLAAPPRLARQG
jgi:hypothetical protein